MSAEGSSQPDRGSLKQLAAAAAIEEISDGMVVGLGTGSTAECAIEALGARCRAGLRIVGVATSERSEALAVAVGIPTSTLSEQGAIDVTIDGADEVERGTLHLVKGLGGALLREKIVAQVSRRLVIVVDASKLVDRLGDRVPVPVEVVGFGSETTGARLEAIGAEVSPRLTPGGGRYVTDGGNLILDCRFGAISQPALLESRIKEIVGVVESGLFIARTSVVCVADNSGVRRLERSVKPSVLVVMGVSGCGKSTVARDIAARLGWPFQEGDSLHPPANIAKMEAGIPLDDADRMPWLDAVAAWIDGQRAAGLPGIITCSALKRAYRHVLVGEHGDVGFVYLRGDRGLIADRMGNRSGHFMPSSLLESQFATLEEPGAGECAITVEIDRPRSEVCEEIVRRLGSDGSVVFRNGPA